MTHLDHHHHLLTCNNAMALLKPTAWSKKPVIKGMNAAGLVPYLHQLKIVIGQNHTPVLDTEWQHGLWGQLGQIKIYQQKETLVNFVWKAKSSWNRNLLHSFKCTHVIILPSYSRGAFFHTGTGCSQRSVKGHHLQAWGAVVWGILCTQ